MSFPLVLGADGLGAGGDVEEEESAPAPAAAGGSWESLVAVYQLQATEAQEEARRPAEACPNDGEPLRVGPDGRLFCPSDGWRPR